MVGCPRWSRTDTLGEVKNAKIKKIIFKKENPCLLKGERKEDGEKLFVNNKE